MIVKVNGEEQEREVDYEVYRGKDKDGNRIFAQYPKLEQKYGRYEHIFEDDDGVKVFTSIIR